MKINNSSFLLFLLFSLYGCFNNPGEDISERKSIPCFEKLDTLILLDSIAAIDFNEIVTCFEWDSLAISPRGTYRKHLALNYKIVNSDQSEDYSRLDWLEGDRGWFYIYFYRNRKILPNALAINSNASSRDLSSYSVSASRKLDKQNAILE